MRESVAVTLATNVGCAILLGVVRAILLTSTTAIAGVPIVLPKMNRMMPAIHIPLDNVDFAIPGLIGVTRLLVAVEIVHLGMSKLCFPSWRLATARGRAASLKSSRLDALNANVSRTKS